jgi:pyruvate formate lyase activating enzyme
MKSPLREQVGPAAIRAAWWHTLPDGRHQCDLCPRECKLTPGQPGFCFVRQADTKGVRLSQYGQAAGLCIDPIEKKPLAHFYPGTSVLSFGTVGCNLGCRFCQNWDLSKARQHDRKAQSAPPLLIAETARAHGCHSVAFTYNDPVVFAEYAMDCAQAAHECDLKTVAVSAGYINPLPRADFFRPIDAVNIDLKSFSPDFYRRICGAELAPVLETLVWLRRETQVWLEITSLLIPGHNDSPDEIDRLCAWIGTELGPATPLHFSAFHPDYKMLEVGRTPAATLIRARNQARAAGLQHVYTGNLSDPAGQSTYCPNCNDVLIGRDQYALGFWGLTRNGLCQRCGTQLAGHFAAQPGHWGSQRLPVRLAAGLVPGPSNVLQQ